MKLICNGSGSSGNSYLITNGNETLILELGMPFKDVKKALNFDLSSIVGAVATHEHGDHFKYHKEYEQAGIPIFAPFRDVWNVTNLGGFNIISFPVQHSVPCFGFYIRHDEIENCLIFATDLEYCKYSFKQLKPSTIMIEANYDKELIDKGQANYNHSLQGHMELSTCLDFIKANDTDALKNVILCHLSARNSDPDRFLTDAQKIVHKGCNVYIATKGLEAEI